MWIFISQFASFTDAIKNIALKYVPKEVNSVVMTWAWLLFTTLTLLPYGIHKGIPNLDKTFWIVFFLRMVFDPIALYLFTLSMRRAEISFVLPLLTLGPVCTMITSFFINGERPTILGLIGFLLIIAGIYFLNLTREHGFLSPFKHLIHSRASVYMVIAAMIWGAQTALFKKALHTVSPEFFALAGSVGLLILFSVIVAVKYRDDVKHIFNKKTLGILAAIGFFDGITVFMRTFILVTGLASYVSVLNRTTIIFSSILGFIFFKEHIGKRIVPIAVMLIGVLLITLG